MFLESTNTYTENLKEDPTHAGAIMIALECEQQWHDLQTKMMRAEYVAIKSENMELYAEASGSFAGKAKDLIMKVYRRIKSWVVSVWTRFSNFFRSAEGIAKKYGSDIKAYHAWTKDDKVKIHPEAISKFEQCVGLAETQMSFSFPSDVSGDAKVSEIIEDIKKKAFAGKESALEAMKAETGLDKDKVEVELSSVAGKAVDLLEGAPGKLKKYFDDCTKRLDNAEKEAIKAADEAQKAQDPKTNEGNNNHGKKLELYKSIASVYSQVIGASQSCFSILLGDLKTVVSAASRIVATRKARSGKGAADIGTNDFQKQKSEGADILDQFGF